VEYRVTWEIDVDAKNPLDAAKQAWKLMRGRNSTANCFTVHPAGCSDRIVLIDLEEEKNGTAC